MKITIIIYWYFLKDELFSLFHGIGCLCMLLGLNLFPNQYILETNGPYLFIIGLLICSFGGYREWVRSDVVSREAKIRHEYRMEQLQ